MDLRSQFRQITQNVGLRRSARPQSQPVTREGAGIVLSGGNPLRANSVTNEPLGVGEGVVYSGDSGVSQQERRKIRRLLPEGRPLTPAPAYKQLVLVNKDGVLKLYVRSPRDYVELPETGAVRFGQLLNATLTSTGPDIEDFIVLLSAGTVVTRYDGSEAIANFYAQNHASTQNFAISKLGFFTAELAPARPEATVGGYQNNTGFGLVTRLPEPEGTIDAEGIDHESIHREITVSEADYESIVVGDQILKFGWAYFRTYSQETLPNTAGTPYPREGTPEGDAVEPYIPYLNSGSFSFQARNSGYPDVDLGTGSSDNGNGNAMSTPAFLVDTNGTFSIAFNLIDPPLSGMQEAGRLYDFQLNTVYALLRAPDFLSVTFGGYNVRLLLRLLRRETTEDAETSGVIRGYYFGATGTVSEYTGDYSSEFNTVYLDEGTTEEEATSTTTANGYRTVNRGIVINESGTRMNYVVSTSVANSVETITKPDEVTFVARDNSPFAAPKLAVIYKTETEALKIVSSAGEEIQAIDLAADPDEDYTTSDIVNYSSFTNKAWYLGRNNEDEIDEVNVKKWTLADVFMPDTPIKQIPFAHIPDTEEIEDFQNLMEIPSPNQIRFLAFDAGAKKPTVVPPGEEPPDGGGGGGEGG